MEQRRTQRYQMQLQLHIIQLGASRVNRIEETRDISSGGVCFVSNDYVEVGDRVDYVITLSGNPPAVRIRCLGKVIRCRSIGEGTSPYEVAITMERYQFLNPREVLAFAIAS